MGSRRRVGRNTKMVGVVVIVAAVAGLASGFFRSGSTHLNDPNPHLIRTLTPIIEPYLLSQMGPADFPGIPNQRWFCATKLLGAKTNHGSLAAYLWAFCEEIGPAGNGRLRFGTGLNPPMVIYLNKRRGHLTAVRDDQPADGSDYESDVRRLFPLSIATSILSDPVQQAVELQNDVRRQALRAFYPAGVPTATSDS